MSTPAKAWVQRTRPCHAVSTHSTAASRVRWRTQICCDKRYDTDIFCRRSAEVAVTSSRTHYEDQVSMLSKCHGVARELIKISPFHQTPQKSIFQTRGGQMLRARNPLLFQRLRSDESALHCANIRASKRAEAFKGLFLLPTQDK